MPVSPLTCDPSRPPPLLAGGVMTMALAELVADCEHAHAHRLSLPPGAEPARLVPASCLECRRSWALMECVLGGFNLHAPERAWLVAGVDTDLLAQLETITAGPARLRSLAHLLGLPYPGAPDSVPNSTS